MKNPLLFLTLSAAIFACAPSQTEVIPNNQLNLIGTWRLLSATTIRGNDTTFTNHTVNQEFIKIINETHFSFISHDLSKGQDATASFSAGAGTYTLSGDAYSEQLDYCSYREWEGHKFEFRVSIHQDTLTQTGVEKIVALGVDQTITEKYVKVK